jgi:hypothetical protein
LCFSTNKTALCIPKHQMAMLNIQQRTVRSGFPKVKQLSITFMHAVWIHWCSQSLLIQSHSVCRQQNCWILNWALRKAAGRLGRAPVDLGQTPGHTNIQRNRQAFGQIFGHTNIRRNNRTEEHSDRYSDTQNFFPTQASTQK